MSSSLGLVGDLDDVEFIQDVEQAFDVRLSDTDLQKVRTVGDIFDLVEAKLPGQSAGGCATAMCFYRLRRAFQPQIARAIRPQTEIGELGNISVRKLRHIIKRECGLRPPPPHITIWGCIALALAIALPVGSLWLRMPWWVTISTPFLSIALFQVTPIDLPPSVKTVGDLVRIVASRSIGTLSQQGARLGPKEAWAAFTDIASDHSALPVEDITPDTLIYLPKQVAS